MAAKVRIKKLRQEIRGLADVTHRRPPTRPSGLFLIQLRSHLAHTSQPRRKLIVCTDAQDLPDVPQPVKIIHVAENPSPAFTPPWL